MEGFTIARDESVTLEHLAERSLIKLTLTDYSDGDDQSPFYIECFFKYDEFNALKRCMKEFETILP